MDTTFCSNCWWIGFGLNVSIKLISVEKKQQLFTNCDQRILSITLHTFDWRPISFVTTRHLWLYETRRPIYWWSTINIHETKTQNRWRFLLFYALDVFIPNWINIRKSFFYRLCLTLKHTEKCIRIASITGTIHTYIYAYNHTHEASNETWFEYGL